MPNIKLTSFGATQEVTGSCHLLKVDNYRLLIDCGFWQGGEENYRRNWEKFDFDPASINAVILTHAHLDHCGRLPRLIAGKYQGKIYATSPTIKLTKIILKDNFQIMNEKAKIYKLPMLHASTDLNKLNESWEVVKYYELVKLTDNISFKIHQAGHILGAGIIELLVGDKTIVFSGDIGTEHMPLVKDIDYLTKADYVIIEGTYGNRQHEHVNNRNAKLIKAVQRVTLNKSTLLISIFAIERTQDILKVLNDYYESHLDFRVPVFLDSPMATEATRVYQAEIHQLNAEVQTALKTDSDIFSFPHLTITNQIRKSKTINHVPPPKIILAGSGMAEGGRIIHHLAQYANNPRNNILFMGFQVPGTLGHRLMEGGFDFDYYGQKIPVKAVIDQIDGFSAHADQTALLKWLGQFKNPKQVFLVHGNKEVLEEFSNVINTKLKFDTDIVKYNTPIQL